MNDEIVDLDNFAGKMFDDFTDGIEDELATDRKTTKKDKIPVVMLSGFLGSGKTTLLNYLLRDNQNLKIGAIINDFGKINIDNMLVAGNINEKTIELSNGCVCCILGDNGLREPLDQLANEDSNIDAIIIEASGIAEPYDLMQTLRHSGNEFTYFGGNVYIVDATAFGQIYAEFPTHFEKCIKTADIILLNKADKASPEELSDNYELLRTLNPRSPIIETVNAEMPSGLLFSNETEAPQVSLFETALEEGDRHGDDHGHSHDHSDHEQHDHDHSHDSEHHHGHQHHTHHIHHRFQSVSFNTDKPLSPKKFADFINDLPANMFRAKGFLYFGLKGYEQKFLLQIVGKTIEISAHEWKNGEPQQTNLVLIGHNLDEKAALQQIENAIDDQPEDMSDDDMINFERYLVK